MNILLGALAMNSSQKLYKKPEPHLNRKIMKMMDQTLELEHLGKQTISTLNQSPIDSNLVVA